MEASLSTLTSSRWESALFGGQASGRRNSVSILAPCAYGASFNLDERVMNHDHDLHPNPRGRGEGDADRLLRATRRTL